MRGPRRCTRHRARAGSAGVALLAVRHGMTIVPVILSGGSGTRLWPVSTANDPTQFQPLLGEDSMFRQTLARAADRTRFSAPIVVCGDAHVEHVAAGLLHRAQPTPTPPSSLPRPGPHPQQTPPRK